MNCQFSFLLCLNTHDNGGKDDAFQLYMLLEITLRKKQNCMLYRNDQYCQASHNNIIDLMLIFHCLSHKPFGASSVNARLETYNGRGVKCTSRNAKIAKFYQKEVRKVKKTLAAC